MDDTFLIGSAAFLSSIIVFVGSVFLLLTLVLGARLAYLVTASVTLSFVLMMAAVWSYGTPLGPVGQLPEWDPVDIALSADSLGFAPAAQYPDDPWRAPNEEDAAETSLASELESAGLEYLGAAIDEGTIDQYEDAGDAITAPESARLLERDGTTYGAITLEPVEGGETPVDAPPVVAVFEFDPGNPSGPARQIAGGTLILFVIHLFFLGRAEKKVLKRKQESEREADS